MKRKDLFPSGALRNVEYANLARRYAWEMLQGCFARPKIRPQDIDGAVLIVSGCVEQNSHFLWLECKTVDAPFHEAQKLFYRHLLTRLRGHSALFVATHPELTEQVISLKQISELFVVRWDKTKEDIVRTKDMSVSYEQFRWWCEEWSKHAAESPNVFIRTFRENANIY